MTRKRTITIKVDASLYAEANTVLKDRGTDIDTWVQLQLRAFAKGGKALIHLSDKMPFGKYQGELVENVVRADTKYAAWMVSQDFSSKYHPDVLALVSELSQ